MNQSSFVGIIGLGYVGLPLARAFAGAGVKVLGFDVDTTKVSQLNAGKSYIRQIPNSVIAQLREHGFEATDQFERLKEPDAILICVPTPLTEAREPDLTYVVNSAQSIAKSLRRNQLVVLESTTYPTTTRKVVLPILEATGLKVGQDFFLAFSPEREDPGNAQFSVETIPKVVGGIDATSADRACALYARIVPNVVRVSSPEVAEACKILENTYRGINIALVNELKLLYDRMGIDVWEVIEAAKTKPFGFQAFYPGPGLGGHCLAGEEWVTVRDTRGVHTLRLSDLYDRHRSKTLAVDSAGSQPEEIRPQNLEALSVDPRNGAARFAPVLQLFRRVSSTPLCRVFIRGNRHLTVTDGHPMLINGYESVEQRRADDLKPGDEVVLLASWPTNEIVDAQIDLIDMAIGHELPNVRVMPKHGCWRDHDYVVRPACIARKVSAKDVYRHNSLPLCVYRHLESAGMAPFARADVLLVTGKGSGWNQVPAILRVDEDLARLIGYYLSEGCITVDTAIRIRLSFGAHADELIA